MIACACGSDGLTYIVAVLIQLIQSRTVFSLSYLGVMLFFLPNMNQLVYFIQLDAVELNDCLEFRKGITYSSRFYKLVLGDHALFFLEVIEFGLDPFLFKTDEKQTIIQPVDLYLHFLGLNGWLRSDRSDVFRLKLYVQN